MSYFYQEVTVFNPPELFRCQPLDDAPVNGRKLFVTNGEALDTYYVYFPSTGLAEFRNGEPVGTPVNLLSRLLKVPVRGYLFTVNRGIFCTGELTLSPFRFPVLFPQGRAATAEIAGTVWAWVACDDCEGLVRQYLEQGVTDPMGTVRAEILGYLRGRIGEMIRQSMAAREPIAVVNAVEALNDDCGELRFELDARFRSLSITGLQLNLSVVNLNELTQYANEIYEEMKNTRTALINTAIGIAERGPISPEAADLVKTYLLASGTVPDEAGFASMLEKTTQLLTRYPMQEVLNTMNQLGMLPPGGTQRKGGLIA